MVSAPDEPAEPDPDGGGGASFPITSETALLGQEISVEFTLSNMRYPLETNISVSITDCPQGWECGSAEIPSLLENEEITVFLPISVPVSTEQRTYRMGIEAVSDQRKLTERLHVTVSPQCNDDFQCSLYERCRSGVCTRLFDIEIERADSPVKPGDFLDFSYTMKEMSGISDDVTIRYWLEGNETVEAEGSEVIYIGPFDEKREDANLYVPEIARGRHMLFVELSHEQYTVQSSRSVVVSMSPELRIDLDISDIPDIQEGRPVPFSFYLGSNLDKPSDVGVEISLLRNGVRRWYLSREMTINRTSIISEAISGLEPGDYVLSARVSYGARTTSIARSFRISGWFRPEYVMLLAIIASLALLSLLLVVFMRRIFRQKELIPGNE